MEDQLYQHGVDLGKRKEFVAEMAQFIEKECTEIGEILAHLSWTPDHILKSSSLTLCPYDPGHSVPESSLKKHAAACRLRKKGASTEDVETELLEDGIFYKNADLVGKVELDEGLLNRILWNHSMENRQVHMGHREMPASATDWTIKLSVQERLAVYEHCVQTLKAQGKMANVERDDVLTTDWEKIVKKGLLEQGQKPRSKFELLAMLRDQKRRRQSYRAKNVHVTRKSYTEIIREVILNQMEIMIPSAEVKQEPPEEEVEDIKPARDPPPRPSQPSDQGGSRNRSRSPRRRRNRSRSRSPERRHQHSRREREDRTPRRSKSRSRSRSPRRKERASSSRQRREDEGPASGSSRVRESEVGRKDDETVEQSLEQPPPPPSSRQGGEEEFEEGQILSEDGGSSPHQHHHSRSRSKKKSSKHKKHKHKKHKSKSHRSGSD